MYGHGSSQVIIRVRAHVAEPLTTSYKLPARPIHRGFGVHTTMDSASCLAGLIARKPTLSNLSLGEMAFDSRKPTELDVPVVAAAVLTCGGDIAADRKAHTGGWVGRGNWVWWVDVGGCWYVVGDGWVGGGWWWVRGWVGEACRGAS